MNNDPCVRHVSCLLNVENKRKGVAEGGWGACDGWMDGIGDGGEGMHLEGYHKRQDTGGDRPTRTCGGLPN